MTKFPSDNELKKIRKDLSEGIASRPLPKGASKVDKIKFKLCEKFVLYKNKHRITQRELAARVGINESLISKIIHYHFDEFTVDRLVSFLDKISPEFDLEVTGVA